MRELTQETLDAWQAYNESLQALINILEPLYLHGQDGRAPLITIISRWYRESRFSLARCVAHPWYESFGRFTFKRETESVLRIAKLYHSEPLTSPCIRQEISRRTETLKQAYYKAYTLLY